VLRSYLVLLRTPAALPLVAASLVGRLSIALLEVPLIVLGSRATGSYAGAGLAAAALSVGIAVSAPARGRVIDRYGARVAAPPLVIVHVAALVGLALAGQARLGALVVAAAALAGLSAPSLPAAMRLEWQRLLGPDDAHLGQAYAFESVAQVSLFVLGPALAGAGLALAGAAATMIAAAVLVLAGGLAFAAQAKVRGTRHGQVRAKRGGPIRAPGVQTLVIATLLADAALGAVAVAVVAFADVRGQAAAAGWLLAIFSISSVLGGTAYGARQWQAPPPRRLAGLMAIAALALLPLALANSVLALAALLVVAGGPFTAQWATTSLALDDVAPAGAGAEAYNWLSAANSAGVALGSLVAGGLVETAGTSAGFLAAAALVALATAFVVIRSGTLTGTVAPELVD
jgi:predicted MFS family arabinose efflux permease